MAKLADAIHFDYIEGLCDEILDKLNEDDETFVSAIGTYEGIRAFIKEFMAYDEVEFDSLVINDPGYNDYYDEYVVDIWKNDDEILFGCEPAKRDGRYLNCGGNVLYLLDDVKQTVLNTCEYDEMYFVIIGEGECDCDEYRECFCGCHEKEVAVEYSKGADGKLHGFSASKSTDNGYHSYSFLTNSVLGKDDIRYMLDELGF